MGSTTRSPARSSVHTRVPTCKSCTGIGPAGVSIKVPLARQIGQVGVEVEIEDNLGNIPETIRYCRLIGDGKTLQMTGNNNYRYYVNIPVTYGSHSYSVQVEDIAGNLMTKRLEVLAK